MARLTKTQREAMEAAIVAEREAEEQATYPQRLMDMLERATKVNFEMIAKEGCLYLDDRDDRYSNSIALTLKHTKASNTALYELEWRVDAKEERVLEEQRRYNLRTRALAKLSAEELEVLGL